MKKYMEPEIEIATFEVEDVITGSEVGGGDENNEWNTDD